VGYCGSNLFTFNSFLALAIQRCLRTAEFYGLGRREGGWDAWEYALKAVNSLSDKRSIWYSDVAMAINPNDPRRKTYLQMVKLARDYRWPGTSEIFSNYLILAICWEETTFMNIPQQKGPAIGFGQLEPSALRLAMQHDGVEMSVQEVQELCLGFDPESVRWIGRVLQTLHDNLIRNAAAKKRVLDDPFMATLNGYAGNFGEYKAAWRDEAIACWLKCANIQSDAIHVVCQGEYVPNRGAVAKALWEGMPPKRRTTGPIWDTLMKNVLAGYPD
jgi:hypothetical protein